LYFTLIVLVLLIWVFISGSETINGDEDYVTSQKNFSVAANIKYYTDIIIFSSFSPDESIRLANEIIELTGRESVVRILSANHLSSSYKDFDTRSLDFYLSTVLTNTEKSTLNDVCELLTSSISEYQARKFNKNTKVIVLGTLPEATSKEDPALFCLENFSKWLKTMQNKSNIEFFTYVNSEDRTNPLDRDLISLIADNDYKVSVIVTN